MIFLRTSSEKQQEESCSKIVQLMTLKRHRVVTILVNADRDGLASFYRKLSTGRCALIRRVAL